MCLPLQTHSSNLIFPPLDLVTVSVRFTRVLYAQLKSQQFDAPPVWKDLLSQPSGNAAIDSLSYSTRDQRDMGMKVTSGFEMLVADAKNGDNRRVREIKLLLEDLDADEESTLPGDSEVANWQNIKQQDDEKWLDINFEDFERELDGKNQKEKRPGVPGAFGPEPPSGFGDAKTQADLKKMVERFEAFLNDDNAGVDGAELDEMDMDDDESEDSEDDSEDEDKDVSFDENEFAKMMREMMGMPSEEAGEAAPLKSAKGGLSSSNRVEELDTDDEDGSEDEATQIRKVMERMEAELNDAGALNLDPTPSKLAALKEHGQQTKPQAQHEQSSGDEGDESDEELDIDFNLAKNLLESFKSQGGMAGPGGNLMGMMGMQLPRDEDDKKSSER